MNSISHVLSPSCMVMRVSPLREFNSWTGREYKEGRCHPYSNSIAFYLSLGAQAFGFTHAKTKRNSFPMIIQLSPEFFWGSPGCDQGFGTGCLPNSLPALLTDQWWDKGVSLTVLWFWSLDQFYWGLSWHSGYLNKKEHVQITGKWWVYLSAIQNIMVAEDNSCWIVFPPKFQGHFRVWQVTAIGILSFRNVLGLFVNWLFGI